MNFSGRRAVGADSAKVNGAVKRERCSMVRLLQAGWQYLDIYPFLFADYEYISVACFLSKYCPMVVPSGE